MVKIKQLEKRIIRVESILILLTIGAIVSGDYLFGNEISLGYLYLIPLSYSALTHRLRTTVVLILLCVVLRQVFGPIENSSWVLIARDWILTGIFLSLVTALQRLGKSRRDFFESARKQRDELVREVELAAQVQQKLLSKHVPPETLDIVAKMEPARVVGGDYYDFISLPDGRTAVVIADVSGKGLPAALLMPAVQIALRALVSTYSRTEDILDELNKVLCEAIDGASFVTLFFAAIDFEKGSISYSNAGHQPIILFSAATGETRRLHTGGPPVGLLMEASFETERVHASPGDMLVLYTDGIVEAENRDEDLYGNERLEQLVSECGACSSADLVDRIHRSVREFAEQGPMTDDATVIVMRFPDSRTQS